MFTNQRPQYLALIDEIKAGRIDAVVAIRLDRFNRAIANQLSLEQIAREHFCFLYAGDDVSDSQTSQGEFMRIIQMGFAQLHARQSAREVMESSCHNVKIGKTAGAVPPYGLKTTEKLFYINAEEAPAVKMIFERVEQGFNYSDIIKELTALGYRTRAGKVFSKSTIISMLRNEKYYGTYIYNRANGKKKKNRVLIDQFAPVVNDKAIPAIITKELFDSVQAILDGRKSGEPVARVALLTGYVKCKACASNMVGTKYKGRNDKYYRTYQCPNHTSRHQNTCSTKQINAEYLESVVKTAITQRLNDYFQKKERLDQVVKPIKNALTEKIKDLKKRIDTLDRGIASATNRLLQTSAKGVIDALTKRIEDDSTAKKFLTAELVKVQKRLSATSGLIPSKQFALFNEEDLFCDYKSGRVLVNAFIASIEIDDSNDEIIINFK